MKLKSSILALPILATLSLSSCDGDKSPTTEQSTTTAPKPAEPVSPEPTALPATGTGAVLATVNGQQLSESTYRQQAFYFNPLSRLRSHIPADRLQAMVESELLWQEAKKFNIAERPALRRQIQQLVIKELVREKVLKPIDEIEISEDDEKQYYQDHIERYHRTASVKVAHILIEGKGEQSKKTAEEILKNPLVLVPGGFSRLVRSSSADKNSSIRGGSLGNLPLPDEQNSKSTLPPWQLTLAQAAMKLPRIGAIHTGLIETDKGYHIIKLTGRRAARDYPFAQVKNKIALQLASEGNAKLYRQYIDALKAKAEIQSENADALKALLTSSDKKSSNPQNAVEKERSKAEQALDESRLPERQKLGSKAVTWKAQGHAALDATGNRGDLSIKALPKLKRPPAPVKPKVQATKSATNGSKAKEQKGSFKVDVKKEVKFEPATTPPK